MRLRQSTQTIGLTCFLQRTLWRTTDETIEAWLMRVSEIRRPAMERAAKISERDWQQPHALLLSHVKVLENAETAESTLKKALDELVLQEESILKQSRADRARTTLTEMGMQVRSLLRLILRLPIQLPSPDSWLKHALPLLRAAYLRPQPSLAARASVEFFPSFWRVTAIRAEPGQPLRMLEAAVLLQLQRCLRNGSVVVPTSLSWRENESLLIPRTSWSARRGAHLQLLDAPPSADRAISDVLRNVSKSMTNLARSPTWTCGDQRGTWCRTARHSGAAEPRQLVRRARPPRPDSPVRRHRSSSADDGGRRTGGVFLDAVRRAPANIGEVLAVYGALLAHGMGLDRIQVRRMMPSVSDTALRTMMQGLEEEGRLAERTCRCCNSCNDMLSLHTGVNPGSRPAT
jgi:hypothetical protein